MRSILVVDDEAHTRRAIGLYLERAGHRVITARNGEEALNRLHSESFDAVVTDMAMPVMGGLELCARIRAEIGREPLILGVTARPGEGPQPLLGEVENSELFEKPLSLRRLLRRLEEHFEKGCNEEGREWTTDA